MTIHRSRSTSVFAVLGAGLLALGAAACGSDEAADDPVTDEPAADPAAGACPEDDPDCFETGAEDTPPPDDPGAGAIDEAAVLADARALLGTPEGELPADVRIGRRGDEQMLLTEDYVIGRMTVELDEVDGTFVVTSVTVELTEGPVVVDDTDG